METADVNLSHVFCLASLSTRSSEDGARRAQSGAVQYFKDYSIEVQHFTSNLNCRLLSIRQFGRNT